MKRVLPLLIGLAVAAMASPAAAQTLPPGDECGADFAAFRARLLDILARRDAPALLEHVDPQVDFSFGGVGPGRDAFAADWGLSEPHSSGLWTELGQALLLGCARVENGEVAAPYLYGRFPEDVDPYVGGVAVPGTMLYPAPAYEGEGAPLAWHIVTEGESNGSGWRRVTLADGRSGYVREEEVLSPIGYRAIFARRDGSWRLVAFIAGD